MKKGLFICLTILVVCTFSFCESPRKPPEMDPRTLTGPVPRDIQLIHDTTADQQVWKEDDFFQYGVNPGYYGNGYSDQLVYKLASDAGIHAVRPGLSDNFVSRYGYDIRLGAFRYFHDTLGFRDNVVFLNQPSNVHRDTAHYCQFRTWTFAHMYEPIWNSDDSVNPDNYYADYVYNIVKRYGPYVKFWEVWNEPDINNSHGAYSLPGQSGNWYDNPPPIINLYSFYAPVFYYVRMLRITYSIVHHYFPHEYVCTGGLGYPSYLDAILRYTDNPDGGKVSPKYPLRGGAYFDVLSYHDYPMYHLHYWVNSIGGFRYTRTSDYAAADGVLLKNQFQAILTRYGYDGQRFPPKIFINTEINICRKRFTDMVGGNEAQRNFIIKYLVKAQQNNIAQVYIFALGESANYDSTKDPFGLMGLYENLRRDAYGHQIMTPEGIAVKTMSLLAYGYRYDPGLTASLRLPGDVDGGAFSKDGKPLIILWAKQLQDLHENIPAVYHFPSSIAWHQLKVYQWDYATQPTHMALLQQAILHLDGTPVFLAP
ncbi:MAG TPA: hypothetical protein VNE41_05370 [Chitinophagaceae bacterium]|nr:hypothetical protein [Chitinophagaceae bacterium]